MELIKAQIEHLFHRVEVRPKSAAQPAHAPRAERRVQAQGPRALETESMLAADHQPSDVRWDGSGWKYGANHYLQELAGACLPVRVHHPAVSDEVIGEEAVAVQLAEGGWQRVRS